MKTLKKILALALGAAMVAGGAALSACSDGEGSGNGNSNLSGEEGSETGGGSSELNEQTLKSALKNLTFDNVSVKEVSYNLLESGNAMVFESYFNISENGFYAILGGGYCVDKDGNRDDYTPAIEYCVKNNDDTYSRYYTYFEPYKLENGVTETYVQYMINQFIFKYQLKDYADLFTFDGATSTYNYVGEISAEIVGDEEVIDIVFSDTTVKTNDGKIEYIKLISTTDIEKEEDYMGDKYVEFRHTLEYYDIGTTTVEVPKEVIDEATANTGL